LTSKSLTCTPPSAMPANTAQRNGKLTTNCVSVCVSPVTYKQTRSNDLHVMTAEQKLVLIGAYTKKWKEHAADDILQIIECVETLDEFVEREAAYLAKCLEHIPTGFFESKHILRIAQGLGDLDRILKKAINHLPTDYLKYHLNCLKSGYLSSANWATQHPLVEAELARRQENFMERLIDSL